MSIKAWMGLFDRFAAARPGDFVPVTSVEMRELCYHKRMLLHGGDLKRVTDVDTRELQRCGWSQSVEAERMAWCGGK